MSGEAAIISILVYALIGWLTWGYVFKPLERWAQHPDIVIDMDSLDDEYINEEGDMWEEVDFDTGEIGANTRAAVRHPKNRDRAYSSSAERFDDGGW